MKYTANQKKILNLLLDKYESSKSYDQTNRKRQTFFVEPQKVWSSYQSDFASVLEVKDFEGEMRKLEDEGLIQIESMGGVFQKLKACSEKFPIYYEITNRKEKRQILLEEQQFYELWESKKLSVIEPFCKDQILRLKEGKKAKYDRDSAEEIFRFLQFLNENEEDLLEREASSIVYSNSKTFQMKYKTKICSLLCEYGKVEELTEGLLEQDKEDQKLIGKILLEEFHIYENFSGIWIKGNAKITFQTGDEILLKSGPVALSSEQIKNLSSFYVEDSNIVTVENLTSFHRIQENDSFYLFLSGYHNRAKQRLLRKIAKDNEGKNWYHFGDLDPDGFYILEHLKKGTGIPFLPLKMGVEELDQYRSYGKELEKNDIVKAKSLIEKGCFCEIMKDMLEHNCKLEQEIISFSDRKKK